MHILIRISLLATIIYKIFELKVLNFDNGKALAI